MEIEQAIYYEDVIKTINDFEKADQEIVNKKPNVIIPYYTLDHIVTELSKSKKVVEKQQKIINEMANYISKLDLDEDICMKNTANTELCNEEYSNCKECIKEYFTKKVEDK